MKKLMLSLLMTFAAVATTNPQADACTRVLYETGAGTFIVGRTMDWYDDTGTDLWTFPRGMIRDGGVGPDSIKWTSKHGSLVGDIYDIASADGINEAGLVVNILYLAEANYGNAKSSGKPLLSVGAWPQYILDNFGNVAEAVEALKKEPFAIVAPELPGGKAAGGHIAIADATGDSAIFEYIKGNLVARSPHFIVAVQGQRHGSPNIHASQISASAICTDSDRATETLQSPHLFQNTHMASRIRKKRSRGNHQNATGADLRSLKSLRISHTSAQTRA